jgi:hypothetical protein
MNGRFFKKYRTQMRSMWLIGIPKPSEKLFGKYSTQKSLDLLKKITLTNQMNDI